MRRKHLVSPLAILVVSSLIVSACGPQAATPTAVVQPTATTAAGSAATATGADTPNVPIIEGGTGILRYNVGPEPDSIDPQKLSYTHEYGVARLVFEGLMGLNEKLEAVPAAAEKMDISADGLKYTFTMRDGLKYSDGQPLTARNFEYAWKRLFDPRVPAKQYSFIGYDIAGAEELDTTPVSDTAKIEELMGKVGIKATDDKHIEFTLKQKAAYFPYVLTMMVGYPSRKDMVDAGGDEDWTRDKQGKYYIGNGPFIMEEYNPPQIMRMVPNPYYRKGKPKINELRGVFITDSAVEFQSYKKGELDAVTLAAEDLSTVMSDAQLKDQMVRMSNGCTWFVAYNTRKAPFDNIKVRQAFAQALDRNDWVQNVEKGLGKVAFSMIPPGANGYAPDIKMWEFNPEAAKKTLADAGYADPKSLPAIKLTYSATPREKTRMEWLQNQFKINLGVDAQLDPVEPKAFTSLVKDDATRPQMSYNGWCQDYPDPQNWLTVTFHSSSQIYHLGWKNDEYDRLTRTADQEQDAAKRLDMYNQAHKILVSDAAIAFLDWSETVWVVRPNVKGIKEHITITDYGVPGFQNIANIEVGP